MNVVILTVGTYCSVYKEVDNVIETLLGPGGEEQAPAVSCYSLVDMATKINVEL